MNSLNDKITITEQEIIVSEDVCGYCMKGQEIC